jgi:hypothetical protein
MWFAGLVLVAAVWWHRRRRSLVPAMAGAAVLVPVLAPIVAPGLFPRMDDVWLTVVSDRDYLFSLDWPLYAWALNLGYVVLLAALAAYRQRAGIARTGEAGLFAGLFALVLVFLATLPAVERHVAFFVALQANRVFWILDLVLAVLGAWWLIEIVPRLTHRRAGAAAAALVAIFSLARGGYVLAMETNRALVEPDLPRTTWTETMRWLEAQPASWHVLADPGHAWKYGSSVRVAARRDTLLELGKDPAMAMYDRPLAHRVADRSAALARFDTLSLADVRRLDAAYDLDVFVDTTARQFDLPVLFRNPDFVAYDLR